MENKELTLMEKTLTREEKINYDEMVNYIECCCDNRESCRECPIANAKMDNLCGNWFSGTANELKTCYELFGGENKREEEEVREEMLNYIWDSCNDTVCSKCPLNTEKLSKCCSNLKKCSDDELRTCYELFKESNKGKEEERAAKLDSIQNIIKTIYDYFDYDEVAVNDFFFDYEQERKSLWRTIMDADVANLEDYFDARKVEDKEKEILNALDDICMALGVSYDDIRRVI